MRLLALTLIALACSGRAQVYPILFTSRQPDVSAFADRWGDHLAGAQISIRDRRAHLAGTSDKTNWGRVFVVESVDLDRPVALNLVIDSVSAGAAAYVILSGNDALADGYRRVFETSASGAHYIELQHAVELHGRQRFQFEFGVSVAGATSNAGAEIVYSEIALVPGRPPAEPPATVVYDGKHRRHGLQDHFAETPSGATVSEQAKAGTLTIQGAAADATWGRVHRDFEIDTRTRPYLDIRVLAVSGTGYALVAAPVLADGYQRLPPRIDRPGLYRFGLPPALTAFRLELGVEGEPNNLNSAMVLDLIRFSP